MEMAAVAEEPAQLGAGSAFLVVFSALSAPCHCYIV